jgi:hypothetical protein
MKVQPNPLTEQSVIRLEISEAGIYNVDIFSPLGQGIHLMKDRYLDKGTHDIALSDVITSLNSDGIYFLRINGMNKTGITKLLVN